MKIGILAFGSLIVDPGEEINRAEDKRFDVETPFGVEYARISKYREGAPTLVPYTKGKPVKAKILVLRQEVSFQEAKDMLYRRERDKVSDLTLVYKERDNPSEKAVLVKVIEQFRGINLVLFTDFLDSGKRDFPPKELAEQAIESDKRADVGKDGITYLLRAYESGVITEKTEEYIQEILVQTGASTLQGAVVLARVDK